LFGKSIFTDLKIAQKVAILWRFYFSKKLPSTIKSRPIGEKSPNLVTLITLQESASGILTPSAPKEWSGVLLA
jgi:hypothetical protein